ncbi:carboxypeptidase-like regulatory domain-containing protein [Tamlana agarivorans]|uniref:Carboxypeptidase-like regulatory domain-containing protein n=1 Tax=Pseudotamlana agarivorans TaxID=481183 RepID=A0ACC5UBN2_9FLAO|nr:MG2 domain-containing protein [Tamlana agarivorans]MBU2951717.1 carboxypeptidase-like regulatory domain-containing protein [Tamlana agarivorans]
MKRILLVVLLVFGTQIIDAQEKYEKLWTEVETYEVEGKFRSANGVVSKILKKARRNKESSQIVKAFIYKSKFTLLLEEDAQKSIINELETSIDESNFPTSALLESIYAGMLHQYLQENSYKIRNRTKSYFPDDSSEFEKWDTHTCVYQISRHYNKSLENQAELIKRPIKDFKVVLTDSKNAYKFRPTLYDFFAHRALDFYKSNKRYVPSPKARFLVSDPAVFTSTKEFVKAPFYTTDSLNSNRKALKLYQNLEQFHQENDTVAYIDVVLSRLEFSKKHATIENKVALYIKALYNLSSRFKDYEEASIIDYTLADFYFKSSKIPYAKHDAVLKNYRVKALEICDSVIARFPNSNGGVLCKVLKNTIEKQTLSMESERYIIPEKPFLAKVVFKSIDSLYVSAYKVPHNYIKNIYSYKKDSLALEFIQTNKPVQTQFYKLQHKKNFYKYTTEINFPKLSMGSYLIIASKNADISSIKDIYSYDVVTASHLSVLSIDQEEELVLKVLNRDDGSLVKNVNLEFSGVEHKKSQGKTNHKGEFYVKKYRDVYKNLLLVASHEGDTLTVENLALYRKNDIDDENEEHVSKMFLYLDRSIYRPGQTVYFKGLLVENKKGKTRVVPDVYTSIFIYDTNDEELKEYRLKTNEYGAVSGEFKIPSNVLTGEFYIEMDEDYGTDDEDEDPYYEDIDDLDYAEVYFSVEEYKRPKFEVLFNDITENYKIGDSIKVSGLAKAFLGSNITDAQVQYSILRKTLSSWGYSNYGSNSQILKTGTTKTDNKGGFNVRFLAIPDSTSSKAEKPIFLYNIEANITDINGETRSATKTVKVGYHNLKIDLLMGSKLNSSMNQQIKFTTTNLNDQPIQAQVEFSINKLSSAKRILRPKPWDVVELPLLSKDKYVELFPNEAYDSTDIKTNRKKEKLVYSKRLNASDNKDIELENISNWEPGTYLLEAKAIDAFKDTVIVKKQFKVYHPNENYLSDKKLFAYEIVNSDFKKDGYVGLNLKTASKHLNVNLEVFYKGKTIFNESVPVEHGHSFVKIPVSKNYTDKLDFNVYFAKFNSLYSDHFSITFKEIEKKLAIETISFRNKLMPDQKETWSFKIINSDNKGAEAEVLASMYDTSLDQFKAHSWKPNLGFQNYNYSYPPRVQRNNLFNTTKFDDFNYATHLNLIAIIKNYHKLNWFGFNFGGLDYENKKYIKALSSKLDKPEYVEGNVNGIIVDESGIPLPGVNVVIKGTEIGALTDFDGIYSLNASVGTTLVATYLGYKSAEIHVTKSGTYNMTMIEDVSHLDEVVVVGYGVQKKSSLTGAVSYVSAKDVSNDIISKLGGQIAGVSIVDGGSQITIRGSSSISNGSQTLFIVDGVPMNSEFGAQFSPSDIEDITVLKGTSATTIYGSRAGNGVVIITTKKGLEALTQVEARSDLKETAFFFPHLKTNKHGEVEFSFDSPQALTKWRLMLLAHNKTLEVGVLEKTAITQKEISVVPNVPRFLRENDVIDFSAKISNLTDEPLAGLSMLQLYDAITMEEIDYAMLDNASNKPFNIAPKSNASVDWKVKVLEGIQALQYKIVAKSGKHTDGESSILPVLSNRTLVTEAQPLWVPPGKTKEVVFGKLMLPMSASQTNHKFTIEYTSNPAWLAIKSLPYLMEFPYECAEQTFSRFYANALAEDIINKNPQIESVFQSWKTSQTLDSQLEKNESLKSILLSESPWVRDSQADQVNKSRIAHLFDKEKLKEQQLQTISKLKELQQPSGGFPWFSGGRDNPFITRHIVAGIGHLEKLNVAVENDYKIKPILKSAISYLDSEFLKHYYEAVKLSKDSSLVSIDNRAAHYLYSRSFFIEAYPFSDKTNRIIDYYLGKCQETWLTQSLYNKGLIALVLHRMKDSKSAKRIIEALTEQAVYSEDNGMYWKENKNSWYWDKAPIETQALLIEAFLEIEGDMKKVEQLKQWLLKYKRTNQWSTTKATTEAIYALLMQGNGWLDVSEHTIITVGDEKIKTTKLEPTMKEAATGYFKVNWKGNEIVSQMASVSVKNKSKITGFGGVYWQYFEDLDKITTSEATPLQINKKVYINKKTDQGEVLIPISQEISVNLGDLITVRIEITSKDDMEFVHLKDLRASGFEPIDVLSEYKWQDGLGYYQSTKDVATHFFFDKLPQGTYIFEYNLRANNTGDFSNGITTIQSMYAPEFANHSKGIRLQIEK